MLGMKLTRLEIYGFKSFAKKLDLGLTGGMTAVVGPNGCGKTNVVDAIRWVLGEQRPSQIRLDCMEDVLFKGSTTRHPLGMAEVSLTVENTTGILPVGMPEVTITRRLFRSGESDYLINKKPCRLADINDLFMDTGMGTDSYSVFELAMINAILSDKTDDRRHIFEEAAGVTKYKARRRTALVKLGGIEDDLVRVGDIISELDRRVGSLRNQAARARRYRRFKADIKERTIRLASHEIGRQQTKITDIEKKLADVTTAAETVRSAMATITADIERVATDIVAAERELDDTGREYGASLEAIGTREKELARLDTRLESLGEIISRARDTAHRNRSVIEQLAESHGSCAEQLTQMTARLDEVSAACSEVETAFRAIRDTAREKAEVHQKLDNVRREIERRLTQDRADASTAEVRHESGDRRMAEIASKKNELAETLASIERDFAAAEEQRMNSAAEVHTLTVRIDGQKSKLAAAEEECAALGEKLRDMLETQAAVKAEHDFLDRVIRSLDGYSEGVKNAVKSPDLNGRVIGVIADLMTVEETYVPAVEASLGALLHAVLVENTGDAVAGAEYLGEAVRGRAAFLALDTAGGGMVGAPDMPGVIGPLADRISAEPRIQPLVKRLFGRVILVESLDAAVTLRAKHPAFVFVTPTGEMAGQAGDIHAGRVADDAGATLGRAAKLKQLAKRHALIDADVESLRSRRNAAEEDAAMKRALIDEMGRLLDDTRRKAGEASLKATGLAARRDAAKETVESLDAEYAGIAASFGLLAEKAERLGMSIGEKQAEMARLDSEIIASGDELRECETELEHRRTRLNELQVERASLTEKNLSLTRELAMIGERREALAQAATRTQTEIENAEREILETGDTKKQAIAALESLEARHRELSRQKEVIEERCAAFRSERSELERISLQRRHELDELTRRESALTLSRDEAFMLMNNIVERVCDEYFLEKDEITAGPDDPDFDPEHEKNLLGDLKRKLHAIGDVNLAAEADYRQEKERLDFLTRERDDLVSASGKLKETITRINRIARSRFMETFNRIRTNFQTMFQEFFDGGSCDLKLEENIDPLEGAIMITARPPGKKVRTINLLSSGERALTAISLLFAIYLVKPSPFCILDEVDAPLDDANIDRFLTVIREFSGRTQFIMVTHNKKTMAAADNLYGITMAEPGLSTLVSVRLSDSGAPTKEAAEPEKAVERG